MQKTAKRPDLDDMPEIDWSRAKIIRRGPRKDARLSLSTLRKARGMTQVELAAAADMHQSDLSVLERREDALVSTLRRYIEALGGRLDLVAVFDKSGHRIRLDM